MPSSARPCWHIRQLVLVLCLLFTPTLEVLDGDREDVELLAAEITVAASEKACPVANTPGDPA